MSDLEAVLHENEGMKCHSRPAIRKQNFADTSGTVERQGPLEGSAFDPLRPRQSVLEFLGAALA